MAEFVTSIDADSGRIPMQEGLIVATTYGRRLGGAEERMVTTSIESGPTADSQET